MNSIDLYKFVSINDLEFHKTNDESDFILFIPIYHLAEWNKLLGGSITDESGLDCVMKDGYFCFYMNYICEWYGIEITDVFTRNDSH